MELDVQPTPGAPAASSCPVSSHNEWDPLEEVIVGTIQGATLPPWHHSMRATMPRRHWELYRSAGGQAFAAELQDAADEELETLCAILQREGVTVRRPEPHDHGKGFATPDWESPSSVYSAMPRDSLLVVGDLLIEAAMAWRSRYFEVFPFRRLLFGYFKAGARWISAPKPRLLDDFYDEHYASAANERGDRFLSAIGEDEPTFDAADVVRFGRDLLVQPSHTTNRAGIEWLQRHLPDHRVHGVSFDDPGAMHIDATLVPLCPGKVLVNPLRVRSLPRPFDDWEVLAAPPPQLPADHPLYMTSRWISMNVLSLDGQRIVVEEQEEDLMTALRGWGFEPIPCPFRSFNAFGGSFHCATLDVRRRGDLEEYFDASAWGDPPIHVGPGLHGP